MIAVRTDPADNTYITVLRRLRYREASRLLLADSSELADVSSPSARWLAAVCSVCGATAGRAEASEWLSNAANSAPTIAIAMPSAETLTQLKIPVAMPALSEETTDRKSAV